QSERRYRPRGHIDHPPTRRGSGAAMVSRITSMRATRSRQFQINRRCDMNKIVRSLVVVAMACLAGVMAGCGGGGSTAAVDTTAGSANKLTLSVETAPAGSLIGGVQGTITLPEGFSVLTKDASEEVQSGVFTASGNAASSLTSAAFTKATRTLKFGLVNASGFSGGEFATLLVQTPAGASVNAADFTLSENLVVDTGSKTMNLAITKK